MTELNMLDDEYCTPQQAAEIRRMKAELPLWQEVAAIRFKDAVTHIAAVPVITDVDTSESTIDATQVQIGMQVPADVSGADLDAMYPVPAEYYAAHDALDRGEIEGLTLSATFGVGWALDVQEHRALNGTTGEENEE